MAPSLLDNAHLEAMIKEPISSFTMKEGSKKGDNVAGELHSLEVITKSKKTLHLVYKVFPEDGSPMLRQYVIGQRIFNIEIDMYTKIRPTLEALLSTRTGKSVQLPMATYYGGLCDGQNDFLCLEDLRPEGYIMPDKFKGLNFPQMDMAMRELAKFHAFTYFLIKHQGESFFEAQSLDQYVQNFLADPAMVQMVTGMFGGAVDICLDVLDKTNPELAHKYRALTRDAPNVVKTVIKTSIATDKKYFPVIIHGDFWCNNILFKYANFDELKPIDIRFVDFQMSRRGNIFEELQYFVFTSTTPAFRKEFLPRVLDSYYTAFMETIDSIKCPKPQNFTKGYFIDNFYDTYLSVVCFLPYAIPLQLGQPQPPRPNCVEEVSPEESLRIMAEDMVKQWQQSPRAIERMESILEEFVGLKLL